MASLQAVTRWLACAVSGLAIALPAVAQYPSKPIRFVAPIPPGGGPDIIGRLVASKLFEGSGQQVIVENRVGGNGIVAGEFVVRAPADGYTLLLGMDSLLTINPHLYRKMPFDPLKDLTPVASLVSNGFFLALHPQVAAKTLAEFIELAKKAQPPLQYASGGNGSQHHLTMERLKARAGFEMVHVPYKGGSPATTATVAGEVSAMMSGTSTAQQIRAGKLRAIAYTGRSRSGILPDVPTIAEMFPGFEMTQWYAILGPVGMPEPVLLQLRAEIAKVLRHPDIVERLKAAGGVEPWITTPAEFSAAIRADFEKNAELAQDIGIRID